MSSLLVRNLDDDIVKQFKALAMQNGLSVEAFHRQTIINLVENKAELQPRNLNEVLLKLPKLEQTDEAQAIFERDSSVGRDIELGN